MTRKTLAILAASTVIGAGSAMAATAWDMNDDGVVDAQEFVQAKASATSFERYDTNDDGKVTWRELGLSETDHVFIVADRNGDGVLTRRELDDVTFYLYDTDRNAMLDEEEMQSFSRDMKAGKDPFPNEAARTGSDVSQ